MTPPIVELYELPARLLREWRDEPRLQGGRHDRSYLLRLCRSHSMLLRDWLISGQLADRFARGKVREVLAMMSTLKTACRRDVDDRRIDSLYTWTTCIGLDILDVDSALEDMNHN